MIFVSLFISSVICEYRIRCSWSWQLYLPFVIVSFTRHPIYQCIISDNRRRTTSNFYWFMTLRNYIGSNTSKARKSFNRSLFESKFFYWDFVSLKNVFISCWNAKINLLIEKKAWIIGYLISFSQNNRKKKWNKANSTYLQAYARDLLWIFD